MSNLAYNISVSNWNRISILPLVQGFKSNAINPKTIYFNEVVNINKIWPVFTASAQRSPL